MDYSDWKYEIARGIRAYQDVTTIEEYLAIRESKYSLVKEEPENDQSIYLDDLNAFEATSDGSLHPYIIDKCLHHYNQRDYETAIFNATKLIEVVIRNRAGLPLDIVGADLINKVFSSNKPILQYSTVKAEQEGYMSLLKGMIQVFKNPTSHRFEGRYDKTTCLAVLLMCSSNLGLIESLQKVNESDM